MPKKTQKTKIHILAECPFFSINRTIPETDSVRYLKNIRNNFLSEERRQKNIARLEKREYLFKGAKLKVKTEVVNY